MNNNFSEWLKIAEEDISAAEWCFQGEKYLWTLVMCQQAIEKTLKAIYEKQTGDIPPKIHNLNKLATDTGLANSLEEEVKTLFDDLLIFYFSSRYPDKRNLLEEECTHEKVESYLNQTKEVFEWLKNRL